jgi:hypothetical protein
MASIEVITFNSNSKAPLGLDNELEITLQILDENK